MKNNPAFLGLEQKAVALFGSEWISALARATRRDRVTIRRWRDGVSSFDHNHVVFAEIDALIKNKIEELKALQRA